MEATRHANEWTTEDVADALAEPGAYPHPTRPPIHVVQTHISYVFLTGDYAYKLKKPVDLGFVDFSTLEKRKHYCDEELRLNQRFAPDLYLEVVPIYQVGDTFTLVPNDNAAVTDYAVKMRQFDEENLLVNVFERGELSTDDMEAIAQKLARLHAEAPTGPKVAANGSPEAISKMLLDLADTIEKYVGSTVFSEQLDRVKTYLFGVLNEQHDRFCARVDDGFIRECHGDLHLKNICIHNGEFEFFDRIEFNPAFMNIDTIYDAAFLYMDLAYRGRSELANRFINTYLEETGDYGGAILLPFYACCRALIRGEVASIQATERETGEQERERAVHAARNYFVLASEIARRPEGRLVVMCGVSGSGKSTVAQELAARLDAIHIRTDAVRKHLAGVPLRERGANIYTPDLTERTYRTLIDRGLELAGAGMHVVLDGQFGRKAQRWLAIRGAREHGVKARIVHCTANLATLEERLAGRKGDISDADELLILQQQRTFESLDRTEAALAMTMDTDGTPDYDEAVSALLT